MSPCNRIKMKKNTAGLLLASSIVLTSIAQLMMKSGMLGVGELSFSWTFAEQLFSADKIIPLGFVLGGLFCYGLSMLAWIGVLTRIELSIAYPFLSLSYILVYLGAVMLPALNESVSLIRFAGILLISIGLYLITRSSKTADLC